MKPVRVALLGIGTVGGGTFRVLNRNEHEITRRAGRRIEIGWIGHASIPLTEQAERYLAEVRTVVAGFGVALLG
jgi:homoserine dehydrogenase